MKKLGLFECHYGKDSPLNLLGKIILFPLILPVAVELWLMNKLFLKNSEEEGF